VSSRRSPQQHQSKLFACRGPVGAAACATALADTNSAAAITATITRLTMICPLVINWRRPFAAVR
jgi:hypothetical protein